MSTLHVRHVPEPIYEALRRRAREHGTSIAAETVRLLQRSLRTDRPDVEALLQEIERTRPALEVETPTAAELVREDRRRR